MANIPFPEPPPNSTGVIMTVGDYLDLTITAQMTLCCSNPALFKPPFPNAIIVTTGNKYEAIAEGSCQRWESSPTNPCSQIRGSIGRTVQINPKELGKK
jgi:hypothetical protein